mmetsp:Transcript_31159/g.96284  ORF Transcript_31159/g.96284 Transcript_31159/m.96284 type:complete len:200 (+) Transcript_31159:77-676(+)
MPMVPSKAAVIMVHSATPGRYRSAMALLPGHRSSPPPWPPRIVLLDDAMSAATSTRALGRTPSSSPVILWKWCDRRCSCAPSRHDHAMIVASCDAVIRKPSDVTARLLIASTCPWKRRNRAMRFMSKRLTTPLSSPLKTYGWCGASMTVILALCPSRQTLCSSRPSSTGRYPLGPTAAPTTMTSFGWYSALSGITGCST